MKIKGFLRGKKRIYYVDTDPTNYGDTEPFYINLDSIVAITDLSIDDNPPRRCTFHIICEFITEPLRVFMYPNYMDDTIEITQNRCQRVRDDLLKAWKKHNGFF